MKASNRTTFPRQLGACADSLSATLRTWVEVSLGTRLDTIYTKVTKSWPRQAKVDHINLKSITEWHQIHLKSTAKCGWGLEQDKHFVWKPEIFSGKTHMHETRSAQGGAFNHDLSKTKLCCPYITCWCLSTHVHDEWHTRRRWQNHWPWVAARSFCKQIINVVVFFTHSLDVFLRKYSLLCFWLFLGMSCMLPP